MKKFLKIALISIFLTFATSCRKEFGSNWLNGGGYTITFNGSVIDEYASKGAPGMTIAVKYQGGWHDVTTSDNTGQYNASFFDNSIGINNRTYYYVKAYSKSGNFTFDSAMVEPYYSPYRSFSVYPKYILWLHLHNSTPANLNDRLYLSNVNGVATDTLVFKGTSVDNNVMYKTAFVSQADTINNKQGVINYTVVKNNVSTTYVKKVKLKEKVENTGSQLNFIVNDTINY